MDLNQLKLEDMAREMSLLDEEQIREAQALQALEAHLHQRMTPLKNVLLDNGYLNQEEVEKLEQERWNVVRELAGRHLPEEVHPFLHDRRNLIDHFIRLQILGRGGMGEVWKAYDMVLQRYVAIKFFDQLGDVTQILREAKTLARFRHPHIVEVYEIGPNYMAMQYLVGETLDQTKLSLDQLVDVATQVGEALEYAHQQGVLHRDIKPQNIMLEERDGQYHAYVMDFGIAAPFDELTSTTTSLIGTPAYMSPEQVRGANREMDPRSDVYSIGALLYTQVTGRLPYQGETLFHLLQMIENIDPVPPSQVDEKLPRPLDNIILKCMEKDRDQRYSSAHALVQDLKRFREGKPLEGSRPGSIYRMLRKVRQNRSNVALLFIAVLGLLAGSTGWYMAWTQNQDGKSPTPNLSSEKKQPPSLTTNPQKANQPDPDKPNQTDLTNENTTSRNSTRPNPGTSGQTGPRPIEQVRGGYRPGVKGGRPRGPVQIRGGGNGPVRLDDPRRRQTDPPKRSKPDDTQKKNAEKQNSSDYGNSRSGNSYDSKKDPGEEVVKEETSDERNKKAKKEEKKKDPGEVVGEKDLDGDQSTKTEKKEEKKSSDK